MVSAQENHTSDINDKLSDDALQSDSIKELIDNCEDNGTVDLEAKTYYLDSSPETHIVLNKSVTVRGIADETVIDGKNTSLFLDSINKPVNDDDGPKIVFMIDGYEIKYTGKNITFHNITFKDLKMTTWHEMTFENCRFINSTFTSYEYPNTFRNCVFEKSKVEIVVFYGYFLDMYEDYSKIIRCNFTESVITCKGVRTNGYIEIVGGDQFTITNRLDLINSSLYDSNIDLYRNNVTISNSHFINSNIMGSSNIFSIEKTDLINPKVEVGYTVISVNSSKLENPKFKLHGGYFSKGGTLSLENTEINNCELETSVSYGTRTGSLKIKNSKVSNSTFNLTDVNLLINNSQSNNTVFELFFSNAHIIDSTFYNDANVTDTIKTRDYNNIDVWKDGNYTVEHEKCQVKTSYAARNSYLINGSGKFEIKDSDINMDTTHKITVINENGTHFFNDNLIIKVEDYMGNPVSNLEVFIDDLNEYTYPTPSVKTDQNGMAQYRLNKLGNLKLKIFYETDYLPYRSTTYGKELNLTVNQTVSDIKVNKIDFKKNTYSNIKGYLKIETVANSNADLKDLKFSYKVYTNKKAKIYYSKTNSKGITTFKLPKTLTAGNHKIEIRLVNTNIKKTVTVKIAKAKTTVKAPKVTSKFKKSKYFKVTVKNKATKKAVSNVKVKIKVFTGKKYKTFTVKTDKKGIAKINTKKLKVGLHPVVISSANGNYQILARSVITIR